MAQDAAEASTAKVPMSNEVAEILEIGQTPLKDIYSTVFNQNLGLEDFLVFEQVIADELGPRRAQFDLAKALRDFLRLKGEDRWALTTLTVEFEALWEHTSEHLAKALPENPPQDQRDKLRDEIRDLLERLKQRLPTANRLRLADPLGHEENEASRYNNAFEDAGGKESVEKYREWSDQAARELERRYPQKPTQSKEYQILGLDALYEEARKVRPLFMKVAEALAQRTYAVLVKGDLKSIAKAEAKCRVRFGGDVSQLCDLVRATLVYHGSVHVMYSALKDMLIVTPQMTFEHQHFLRFEDHFVGAPLPGGYRTVTLQVVIDCHVCELQVTVKKMAEAYEKSDRHRAFRNWDEDILSLAMKRDWTHCKLRLSERNCHLLENEIGYIVNVNHARDKLGRVAMHWAASHGELEICDLLAKRRANVSAVDDKGDLPFARALTKGHLEVADFLLKRHADSLHSVNGSREISQKTRQRLEWLLDWVTDKAQDDERFLPFVRLIAISDSENVIDRAAPGSTLMQRTRLHLACAAGQRGVVRALCQGRSNPNLRDKDLCTPLHIAALELNPQGQAEVWQDLHNEGQLLPYSGQRMVMKQAKADIMDTLIQFSADVNAPTGTGMTCLLHVTCLRGLIKETEALLNANAEVNIHDDNGSTPMHLAAHYGWPLILRALTVLGKHVDVNANDNRGYTPLDVLTDAGHPRECSKHLESRDGRHSLFWAIHNNQLDVLKSLLDSKADPYVRNRHGESAADLMESKGIRLRFVAIKSENNNDVNTNGVSG